MSAESTLVLGGGCFWCLEAVYELLPGVTEVTSGYAGGHLDNPTYEQVCTGETGHAEVIEIRYNPNKISLKTLLEVFWEAHDPTTPNRQGHDVGTQYRSIILYQNSEQLQAATQSLKEAQSKFDSPIVTEIVPLKKFYPAEAYHQDYYRRNPQKPYCQSIIKPKLEKLKKTISSWNNRGV
ncbi:MAG: peptide-methionine (S)-S-oxide reductase MsrA [Methylacidiphilales bacterium]|nr:peptide-methionine (S)-S-oxide reductase MsrA [Candidatus Methylacidiphilales bacterium]MDW8348705.1 peptide-methionine (S)-S-oxide reductase MsrA [Verrucomicrobiae bacterium]